MIGWVRVRLKRTVLLADVGTNHTEVIFRVTKKISVSSRWCYKSGPSKLTGPLSRDPSFHSVLYQHIDIINTFVRSARLVFTLCNDQIFGIFNRARIQFWGICCVNVKTLHVLSIHNCTPSVDMVTKTATGGTLTNGWCTPV